MRFINLSCVLAGILRQTSNPKINQHTLEQTEISKVLSHKPELELSMQAAGETNVLANTKKFKKTKPLKTKPIAKYTRSKTEKRVTEIEEGTFFSEYRSTNEIYTHLNRITALQVKTIGTTYEGANINAYKIGQGQKAVILNGGTHPREWASPMVVAYIADFLASNRSEVQDILDIFTFHLIPVLNVDGYEYSRNVDRMWRKNREPNEESLCIGTDLNRNFEFQWGELNSSDDPCSQIYQGSEPSSSYEVAALSRYISQIPFAVNFIDFHSFAGRLLYSPGWICGVDDEFASDFKNSLRILSNKIKEINGDIYTFGSGCDLYPVGGASDDTMHEIYRIKYSFTFELAQENFIGSAADIKRLGESMAVALVDMWHYIDKH
jgi:hypothetical protein